jgi:hypothetical protein
MTRPPGAAEKDPLQHPDKDPGCGGVPAVTLETEPAFEDVVDRGSTLG